MIRVFFSIIKKIHNKIFRLINYAYYSRKLSSFGKNSYFYRPLRIVGGDYINIGESVHIFHGMRMEAIDEWNGKTFCPNITIGDNVAIQQGCHITCADQIIIGDNTSVLPYVLITDISHIYEDVKVPPGSADIQTSAVNIGKGCMIGYGSTIMPGVSIGDNCVVGANAVVVHDVPDGCVVAGQPAKVIKRFDYKKNKWEKVDDV